MENENVNGSERKEARKTRNKGHGVRGRPRREVVLHTAPKFATTLGFAIWNAQNEVTRGECLWLADFAKQTSPPLSSPRYSIPFPPFPFPETICHLHRVVSYSRDDGDRISEEWGKSLGNLATRFNLRVRQMTVFEISFLEFLVIQSILYRLILYNVDTTHSSIFTTFLYCIYFTNPNYLKSLSTLRYKCFFAFEGRFGVN